MSLLLHYKFDDTNVTLDSSGNNSHLTNSGVTTTIDPDRGRVALFNGWSFLTLNEADTRPTGSPRTVSIWFNMAVSQHSLFFDLGSVSQERFLSYIIHNRLKCVASFATQEHPIPSINRWYHIVVTFDGSSVSVYQDGVLLETSNGSPNLSQTRVGSLFLGRLSNLNGYFFNGKMADMRLYDDALDSTEISDMFSNGPNGTTVALIPGTIKVQEKASTTISCLIEGDPKSTYRVEVGGQIIDNVKAGENIVVDGLESNTTYNVNLY